MNRFRTPAQEIRLAEGSQIPPEEIQLAKVGTFYTDAYGKVTITTDDLNSMVTNWEKGVRGIDLALDYGHAADREAAGWFTKVYVQDGATLWAKVDWTPRGAKAIVDKEYRYISSDFMPDYQDNESQESFGCTLFGAGLTNRPVIKRMEATLPLSELTEGDAMNLEQLKAENKRLSDEMAAMKKTCDDAAMSPEEMQAKIKEQADTIASLQGQLSDSKTALEEATKGKEDAAKLAEFNALLAEGKAVPKQKESFLKGDMASFARLSEAGKINLSAKGSGESNEGTGGNVEGKGDASDKLMVHANKMLSEGKVKTLSEGVRAARKAHPELAKEADGN